MVNNLLPVPRIERNRIELICCCCSCSFVFSLIWTINISHVKFIQPADSTLCMTSDTGVIPILFILLYLSFLYRRSSLPIIVFSLSRFCACVCVSRNTEKRMLVPFGRYHFFCVIQLAYTGSPLVSVSLALSLLLIFLFHFNILTRTRSLHSTHTHTCRHSHPRFGVQNMR